MSGVFVHKRQTRAEPHPPPGRTAPGLDGHAEYWCRVQEVRGVDRAVGVGAEQRVAHQSCHYGVVARPTVSRPGTGVEGAANWGARRRAGGAPPLQQTTDAPLCEPVWDTTHFALTELTVQRYGGTKVASENAVRERLGTDRSFVVRPGIISGLGDQMDRFGYWAARFARGGRHDGRNGFEHELARLGVIQKNSLPNHPTTCGKVERFHRP